LKEKKGFDIMSQYEEDDDFDDLLDEFADQVLSKPPGADLELETPRDPDPTPVAKEAVSKPTTSTRPNDNAASIPELDEEFAQKLKLGLDYILEEMKDSPEQKESFEALMAGISSATGSTTGSAPTTEKQQDPLEFQDTISKTMNRLKTSHAELKDKDAKEEDDFMAKMMKELESAAGSNGGNLDGLLGDMLQELSSKAILYEPMKEMHDKFPGWLEKNAASLSADERTRYENQQQIVADICAKFEDSKYSDDDGACRKYIAEKMEDMQKSGAPPAELMGDLAGGGIPGLDMNLNDIPNDLEGCPVQ
jgi:peroxin-19